MKRYQVAIEHLRDRVFVSTQSNITEFLDLSTLSGALHKEAAALEVLAKTIKGATGVNHPSAIHKTKLLIEEWIITQQEISPRFQQSGRPISAY